MSTELKVIIIVALEHFLLLLAWIIHKGIPDRPGWVRIALARNDYESKQALKREVNYKLTIIICEIILTVVFICFLTKIYCIFRVVPKNTNQRFKICEWAQQY